MPESITQPAKALKVSPPGRIIRGMSEETTRNLPQDGVERILARLASLEDKVDNRFSNVENRLSTLEERVERRLQETRPIWEQVLVRLDGVESRLGGVESKVQTLEGEVSGLREEMRSGFRRFERAIMTALTEVSETRGDQRDLEKRVEKLEEKMT